MNTTVAASPRTTASSTTQAGIWRMALAMLLSGTIGLFVIESGLPPELVVFLRCVIGASALALWITLRREWVGISVTQMCWLAAGGVALVVNWVALFHAYQYAGIGMATVVYHVQPFFLVIAAAWGGEKIGWARVPWMLWALAGVVLSSGVVADAAHSASGSQTLYGVLLSLLAAALYTLTVIATRRVKQVSAAQSAMFQMLAGGAVLAFWGVPQWLNGALRVASVPMSQTLMCVLVLGLVHTALMYVLMYGALQRLGAGLIAILSFIYPAIALVVDLWWFGVRPGAVQWLGMALIALAIAGYRWRELK